MGDPATPLVELNRLSQTQELGDPLTLAKRQESLICYKTTITDFVIITLDQTFSCHFFKHQAQRCASSVRQSQLFFNLWTIQSMNFLVAIHRQHAQDCELIGSTKRLGIGDGGRKHDRSGVVDLLIIQHPEPIRRVQTLRDPEETHKER